MLYFLYRHYASMETSNNRILPLDFQILLLSLLFSDSSLEQENKYVKANNLIKRFSIHLGE